MTMMIDAPDVEIPDEDESQDEDTTVQVKKRERDFTKFRPAHQELADFVNENSGLDPISPNQVKALLALRVDFNKLPEQVEKREQRKTEREAEKQKYAGMSAEQVKVQRAADRAEKHAAKLEARVAEAKAKAEALRSSATMDGTDLVAAVEAAQTEQDDNIEAPSKRRLGRRR